MLALCTQAEGADPQTPKPLDAAALAQARSTCHALEDEGFRVLAIAWRPVPPAHDHAVVNDESELVLVGFAAFLDPPKESAAGALEALQQAGVAIKVVTGDSDRVTRHVCRTLGLPVQSVLTGADIAQLSDEALRAHWTDETLKLRVVRYLVEGLRPGIERSTIDSASFATSRANAATSPARPSNHPRMD